MDAAMERNESPPISLTEAHTAIQVLQDAVRASVARERELQRKVQDLEGALTQSQEKEKRHATELNRFAPQQPGDALLQRNEDAESGFVGVARNKSRWAAHTAREGGVRKHIGTFDTPIEAARARHDMPTDRVAATTSVSATAAREEVTVSCLWSDAPVWDCPVKLELEEGREFLCRLLQECKDPSARPNFLRHCHNLIDDAEQMAVALEKPKLYWIPGARRAVNLLYAWQVVISLVWWFSILIVVYFISTYLGLN